MTKSMELKKSQSANVTVPPKDSPFADGGPATPHGGHGYSPEHLGLHGGLEPPGGGGANNKVLHTTHQLLAANLLLSGFQCTD